MQIAYARVLPLDTAAIYSYTVTLNDAAELEVKAVFTYEEEYGGAVNTYEIGADGPYSHTVSGTTDKIEVGVDEFPTELPVTLTLTGTYTDNHGVEQEITVFRTMEPFITPTVWITSAQRDSEDPDRIIYSAQIKPNSADELEVMVEVDATDVPSVSDGPFTFTSDGALTDQTILANGSSAYYVTLTLTGSYTVGGEVLTIVETADLDPFEPFEAPTLSLLTAEVEPFEDWGDAALTYSYHLDVGTAENVSVKASVAAGTGPPASADIPAVSFSESGDLSDTVPLDLAAGEASVVLTLLCTYEDYDGVENSFTVDQPILITMTPEEFGMVAEYYAESDTELAVWLSVTFVPRESDPHKADYDFQITSTKLNWYDADGNVLTTVELVVPASAGLTGGYESEYGYYQFPSELTTPIVESAASLRFSLTMQDAATGKTYSTATELMELY